MELTLEEWKVCNSVYGDEWTNNCESIISSLIEQIITSVSVNKAMAI